MHYANLIPAVPTCTDHPTALIWRMRLLPVSETFIQTQATALIRFSPFFAGRRRVKGLDTPEDLCWTINRGGLSGLLKEIAFLYCGPSAESIRTLATRRPALLHAHFCVDAVRALTFASALGIPLVTTFHGYDITRTDEALRRTRDGRFYLKNRRTLQTTGAHFIAVSNFIRSKMEASGYPAERTSVHYIGVDTKQFEYSPRAKPGARVLFVGRLIEKKGCAILIRALEIVQQEIPDLKLIVIGDGDQRHTLEQEAARKLNCCRFLGSQPSSTVRQELREADVFCVPSIPAIDGDSEGLGMVFLEAQATGVPVVSFASGGIQEAVVHGETGLLAAGGDWKELAASIARILKDSSLWNRFSQAARLHVETNFDLTKQTSKLEDLYCQILTQFVM